ncbi:MAG TPA: hypothetical protein VGN52_06250 [Burkholderiales bacterium]
MSSSFRNIASRSTLRAACAGVLLAACALGAPAAFAAHGHGGHGGGHWSGGHGHPGGHWHGRWHGGVVIGPGYDPFFDPFYSPFYDFPPPAPVPVLPPETYVEAAPGTVPPAAPAQPLTPEQKAQRLAQMCAQGVFSADECANRRTQLLNEM